MRKNDQARPTNRNLITSLGDNMLYGLRPKMNDGQLKFADMILNKDVIFCDAMPGSGKTTIATAMGKLLVEYKCYKKLLYLFANTEEDELGFLPGSLSMKEAAYLQPLIDALLAIDDRSVQRINDTDGWVEASSHAFKRGINLIDRFIIIDEAQNWIKQKLKKVISRAHEENCKIIIIGDTEQCDLPNPSLSGFASCMKHFRGTPRTGFVTLDSSFRGWIAEHIYKW